MPETKYELIIYKVKEEIEKIKDINLPFSLDEILLLLTGFGLGAGIFCLTSAFTVSPFWMKLMLATVNIISGIILGSVYRSIKKRESEAK